MQVIQVEKQTMTNNQKIIHLLKDWNGYNLEGMAFKLLVNRHTVVRWLQGEVFPADLPLLKQIDRWGLTEYLELH